MCDVRFNSTWNLSSYVFWNQMKTPIPIVNIKFFWECFNNLKDINKLGKNNITFFRKGISASWEDPKNRHGSIIGIALDKNISSQILRKLIQDTAIYMVAENFPCANKINGFVIRMRYDGPRFDIWVDRVNNKKTLLKIINYFILNCLHPNHISGKVICKNQSDAIQIKSCYKSENVFTQEVIY